MNIFEIRDLEIDIVGKHVVKNITLSLVKGTVNVMMGPNGSGKSTLAQGLMGHPGLTVRGNAFLEDTNILELSADERSRRGLFLSFQHPAEISGVTVSNFLRTAMNARRDKSDHIKLMEFMKILNEKLEMLKLPKDFASRYLNEGFSGGEKKKMEILQLAMLEPIVAILDETDSGLDIDALKTVCEAINIFKKKKPDVTLLIITHYQRMLDYLDVDNVHIMYDGQIIKEGDHELALDIEKNGYEKYINAKG